MKTITIRFMLPLLALFGVTSATSVAQDSRNSAEIGTQETLIVASGTMALNLDMNRLNGASRKESRMETLRFQAAPDSFLPLVVFNDQLRGAKLGSIALNGVESSSLPAQMRASFGRLVLERIDWSEPYELVVRDAKTGFVFFNIEGHEYAYDAAARTVQITDGRLLLSEGFAKNMGRPADAGAIVGSMSLSANLRVIETEKVRNGVDESASLPSLDAPSAVNGPDVIVGDLPTVAQVGGQAGSRVGVVVATTSCNNGNVPLNWLALPGSTDHPVIPQNFYRMSGGASNTERFEQIGQSWLKHAFLALQQTVCGTCTATPSTQLGVGCSDPYAISENQTQSSLGSRTWVNPFTGAFPLTANSHTGHTHDGTSHRTLVEVADLNTNLNPGATYFAEGQYVTPHEYAWCQAHAGECNMYNNVSYRRFSVTGTASPFTFGTVAGNATQRQKSAIEAWTGATINRFEPEPGIDGQGYVGFKVSGPVDGVYHYEYAVYNQNLDRGIQSFRVPLGCGVSISNLGFHAPPNPPVFANDNVGGTGLSNVAWAANQATDAVTWSSETFAQNANANALRWGTLYNFRFDSAQPPVTTNATIGFFKTGAPITVQIQAPSAPCAPLTVASAVSRKVHGGAGTFDIDLPLAGEPGVECRSGDLTLVATFSNNVVSGGASLTAGTATIGSPSFSGNTMTVNLSGVADMQKVTVSLNSVTDQFAQTLPNTSVSVNVLVGDVNRDKMVDAVDIAQEKALSGFTADLTNFWADMNFSGGIDAVDISQVKSASGHSVP